MKVVFTTQLTKIDTNVEADILDEFPSVDKEDSEVSAQSTCTEGFFVMSRLQLQCSLVVSDATHVHCYLCHDPFDAMDIGDVP